MPRPMLWLIIVGVVLSGCDSLSGFRGRAPVAPLKVQVGGSGSVAFAVVDAEEVTSDPLPPVTVPDLPALASVGVGERARPDGRYLPLVLFPVNSWELTPEVQTILQQASEWLRTYLHGELAIEGHTDTKGTEAYNQALGFKRALAVIQYFEDLGLKPGTMKPVSYGELDPICQREDVFCDDMNRRAFVFVADRALAPLLTSFQIPLTDLAPFLEEHDHE